MAMELIDVRRVFAAKRAAEAPQTYIDPADGSVWHAVKLRTLRPAILLVLLCCAVWCWLVIKALAHFGLIGGAA